MKINQIKIFIIAIFILGTFVLLTFPGNITKVKADGTAEETYKKSCLMCHKADASKSFDTTKADADLEKAVLEGKDVKPIKMPEFASKGVDAAKAKELVAYMKGLRAAAKPPANTQ
jgi:cytochrome c5